MMRAPRLLEQEGLGQQPDDVVALDEVPRVIEQEAAIEIPVKRDAQIGPQLQHGAAGLLAALGQQRVGDAVGKVPVRLAEQAVDVKGGSPLAQASGQRLHHVAGGPVAAVDHQLERSEGRNIDVTEQVIHIGVEHVERVIAPLARRRRELATLGQGADRIEPAVTADGARLLAHQLHAVVVDGVVAGGHLDAAVEP